MSWSVRSRLPIMMFAQYFIWGAWWVMLGAYLNAIVTQSMFIIE